LLTKGFDADFKRRAHDVVRDLVKEIVLPDSSDEPCESSAEEPPAKRRRADLAGLDFLLGSKSSSSRMRVIYHNWSATKQRPHPQSVADISHHSVLSGDRIRQCETSSGSRHKDTYKTDVRIRQKYCAIATRLLAVVCML